MWKNDVRSVLDGVKFELDRDWPDYEIIVEKVRQLASVTVVGRENLGRVTKPGDSFTYLDEAVAMVRGELDNLEKALSAHDRNEALKSVEAILHELE